MAQHILVDASEVWGLFQREKEMLSSRQKKIAENPEFGAEIYLEEVNGRPRIVAYLDDEEVYGEFCVNADDCRTTARNIYSSYLTENVLNYYFSEEDEVIEQEMEIDDRESELDMAFCECLDIILDSAVAHTTGWNNVDEIYEDIKEHTLEYMARRWGLPIRRPMFLEDENGETFYEEYPYECMEFDDEDNPIYKPTPNAPDVI